MAEPGDLDQVRRLLGAEYDRVMAEEQRTGVLVTPARVYGNASV